MRNRLLTLPFQSRLLPFLGQIIQEEINENGIDLGLGVQLDNLASQQLNSPDAAPADLQLPGVA